MKIERLEQYREEESEDFRIDKAHITACLMKLPNLHSKWMRRLMNEQQRYLKMESIRRKLFRRKHKYYLTEYELELRPNHMIFYIESDEEYSKVLLKIDVQKHIIKYIESVMDKIKNQNYVLRNIIDWERFKAGT